MEAFNRGKEVVKCSAITLMVVFLSLREQVKIQILCKRFYIKVIPQCISTSRIEVGHNSIYVKYGEDAVLAYCIPTRTLTPFRLTPLPAGCHLAPNAQYLYMDDQHQLFAASAYAQTVIYDFRYSTVRVFGNGEVTPKSGFSLAWSKGRGQVYLVGGDKNESGVPTKETYCLQIPEKIEDKPLKLESYWTEFAE